MNTIKPIPTGLYTEQVPIWVISVQRKDTLAIEKYTMFSRELPDYFHCFLHQWTKVWISKIEKEPIVFGRASGKSRTLRLKKVRITNGARNRDHEHVFIRLADETTVTCGRTGISFKVTLPSQVGTNLVTVHPLSLASNCLDLLAQCSRHGVLAHTRYERQVLAGMAITLMRAKHLVRVKDPVKANLFLQNASPSSLTMLLQYVGSLSTSIGLPSMSLEDTRENAHIAAWDKTLPENTGRTSAEVLIHNWIRDCKAARTAKHSKETKQARARGVKVYSKAYADPLAAEALANKTALTPVKHAMKMLNAKHYEQHHSYMLKLQYTVNNAQFLSVARRKYFAEELIAKFGEDVDAKTVAASLMALKTDALEADIDASFAVSATVTPTGKSGKVDLLKYLKKG